MSLHLQFRARAVHPAAAAYVPEVLNSILASSSELSLSFIRELQTLGFRMQRSSKLIVRRQIVTSHPKKKKSAATEYNCE